MSDATIPTSDLDDDYDPFAVFDESVGIGQIRDPYPVFHELRSQCPVHAGGFGEHFDTGQMMDPALMDGEGTPHAVLSFEAVQQVLKDGETFSSSGYADSMGLVMGHSILEMDEPEHHSYRSLIQQAFTRKAMETWEAELVSPIATTSRVFTARRSSSSASRPRSSAGSWHRSGSTTTSRRSSRTVAPIRAGT